MGSSLDGYLPIAKVGKAHGIKGELKVFFYPGMPDDLSACREVRLQFSGARSEKYFVEKFRPQGKFFVVKFKSVNSRNDAEPLTGAELFVDEASLPEAFGDQLYWYEYKGLAVFTDSGEELGEVEDLFATGAHDILVVKGNGREYLLPVTDEVIVEVNLSAGRIVVTPTPGLLDINA